LNAAVPAPIPSQVADGLVGKSFTTFADLREAIWRSIADNDELNGTFNRANLVNIEDGLAPFAPKAYQINLSDAGMRFNLHHVVPIESGGAVYDLSNLQVVSPSVHVSIHQSM
jgi:hypothetical protein